MSEPLEIDLFWSFRSPWSYLATHRLAEWHERYALAVRFRVVHPIAIREPDFFQSVNPLWPRYLMIDVHRVAEFLGVPFKWRTPTRSCRSGRTEGRARRPISPTSIG